MSVIVQRLLPVFEGTALCQEHVHSQSTDMTYFPDDLFCCLNLAPVQMLSLL